MTLELLLLIPNLSAFNFITEAILKNQVKIPEINLNGANKRYKFLIPVSLVSQINDPYKSYKEITNSIEIRYFDGEWETSLLHRDFLVVCQQEKLCHILTLKNDELQTILPSTQEKRMFLLLIKNLWSNAKANLENKRSNYESHLANDNANIQNDFINICAHELRAPLHPILLQADLLKKKVQDANQYNMAESIYNNARRMGRIIDDLLEMARIDSALVNLKKEKFSLNDLLDDLVIYYTKEILADPNKSSEIKIEYTHYNTIFFVNADKDRIQQVLVNIINNALKFTAKGKISIFLDAQEDDNVRISISDTGPGIDKKISDRLFTKFTSTSSKGLGLGLYISKNIVEMHNGKIWMESNPHGNSGCTFHIQLPVFDWKKHTDSKNILIVDKDKPFTSKIKAFLSEIGYNVDLTEDLIELQDYIQGYYSMIIIDHSLEEDDRTEIIKKIKLKDKVKVCYLTKGKTNYESFSLLYGIGKDDLFVSKALKPEHIARKIDTFCKT